MRDRDHKGPLNTALLSCRADVNWLSTAYYYQFEDLIADWMDATVITPRDRRGFTQKKLANAALKYLGSNDVAGGFLSAFDKRDRLKEAPDFVFVLLPGIRWAQMASVLNQPIKSSTKRACLIPESWSTLLQRRPFLATPLKDFDHIFVSTLNSVDAMQSITGVKTTYLPFAVDALDFSPFPHFPDRHIDVLNIGRRSAHAHDGLLRAMKDRGLFYEYDTVRGLEPIDWRHHRTLFANRVKRSKYFISNTANFDQPEKTGGFIEIGHRFYEGAAGGAILLSHHPVDHQVLNDHFDWPDALIQANRDAENLDEIIEDLEAQPQRIARARVENVRNCLLRHDYVHRWWTVLETMGIPPTPKMVERKELLKRLAGEVEHRMLGETATAA